MLHPSYTDLIKVLNSGVAEGEEPAVNSRYSVVIAASRRARQIIDEQQDSELNESCSKPLSVAVDEFNRGEVTIVSEEDYAEEDIDLDAPMTAEESFVSESETDSEENMGAEEPLSANTAEEIEAELNPEE